MSMFALVAKQITRQATLQPRLALPAGRTVSLEEGRRLAKLVNDEEERLTSEATQLLDGSSAETPVVLEEQVSKRILLLRQKQNKEANIKAAVAYAKRQRQTSRVSVAEGEKVQSIAKKVLRAGSDDRSLALQRRRARAVEKTSTAKKKKR